MNGMLDQMCQPLLVKGRRGGAPFLFFGSCYSSVDPWVIFLGFSPVSNIKKNNTKIRYMYEK